MFIYKITNIINNKVYIGLTTTTIQKRWSTHKRYAIGKYKNHPLYNAMNLYGINNFTIDKICEADNILDLSKLERYYISYYKSQDKNFGYNITAGGENNQYDSNPRAKLNINDIINIRDFYNDAIYNAKEIYNIFYKNKISYSAFEKIYEGYTWKGIHMDVYTNINKIQHIKKFKARIGEQNGNSKYSDDLVFQIRKYYVNHTLDETYKKFGSLSKSKNSFRNIIDKSYKHIPYYKKLNKKWYLNDIEIDINNYNPVSTISGSGE